MEDFFSPNSSEDQPSDADQRQIIGWDAEVDHTQIIGRDAVKLLRDIFPSPPSFGTSGFGLIYLRICKVVSSGK